MVNRLNGKRLLLLGGQLKMCDVINAAKKLGIYTVVTDWYEDSPAKKIADKYYDISTSDVDAIVELIKKERIDGVFTSFIDSTLPYYYEICKKTGLNCYLNEKLLECCTNKRRFRDACAAVGISPIPEVDISDPDSYEFPILIKPADNSGSKGITVCSDTEMLKRAYERAKRFSKSRTVIAERFMNCDYVAAYYTVSGGKAELSLLMDKDMNRIGRGAVPYPTAFVMPSRYHDFFIQNIHGKVVELFKYLHADNGTYQISFFVSGKNYYAVELSARLSATREYVIIEDIYGYNTIEMHLSYALGGKFEPVSGERKENKRTSLYGISLAFVRDGYIGGVEGVEEIKKTNGVIDVIQLRDVGAKVRADGSYGQLFFRTYLKADSVSELIELFERVSYLLEVFDDEGKPMKIAGFDAGRFFGS